ncbi:RNase adapter RapZ [Terasakiella sp. A23]|uniref:RNase adapter RapZ n=1 Tax=Terasakiella sp. FCG-A23 TaxID=3080561 RepID=UPI002952C12B|nr:RNase adapter RapZ [Terasakiella sp. A23]MDV7338401.1 RNase adapter RapZ [Terasakiella sp. A23]
MMQKILIVTGLSGAGITTSLKILEDMGYETIDGVPLSLLPQLVGSDKPMAVGIDIRTRGFGVDPLLVELDKIKEDKALDLSVVFLDCEDEIIERRYVETRHRHPLADERPVSDGIRHERQILAPLQDRCDLVIDTTNMAIKDCKRILQGHFSLDDKKPLSIFVTSFSFKKGIPREADLVFDVRFLRNPYYDQSLRALTGEDDKVGAYVSKDEGFDSFFKNLKTLIQPLLPRYAAEGKSYLTIAIGCTGGQHRSVFIARKLNEWLEKIGENAQLQHRELTKSSH